jgi:hypothetical protein
MEKPTARKSQFRSFRQISTLRTAKNIAVELGVHDLAFGGKFMVHNPSNFKKRDEELVSKNIWIHLRMSSHQVYKIFTNPLYVPETAVHTMWTLKYDTKYVKCSETTLLKMLECYMPSMAQQIYKRNSVCVGQHTAATNITKDLLNFLIFY